MLAAAGLLAAALALRLRTRHTGWARLALIALSLLAGFGWSAWRAEVRLGERLASAQEGVDLVVSGVVAGLPAQAARGQRFAFALDDAGGMPSRVLLGWEDAPAGLRPGERYVFTVRLRQPHGLANPHGFDYEFWLMAAGLGATGYVRDAMGEPRDAVGERLAWRIARWRAQVRDHVLQSLPADARFVPVLAALVVGDQRGIQQRD
ncbi:ComEC/Rec2 family competence protein [Cupriavidus sp. D39]|uniref:ComEC/Rec2 family competence protein n=1 Tax=Cupriavidus sp. D39 TaxID=2997877 RepID=UPI002D1E3D81|nr:ComEC/Rec2 family competence protein [Cupriavidus sp. D39]